MSLCYNSLYRKVDAECRKDEPVMDKVTYTGADLSTILFGPINPVNETSAKKNSVITCDEALIMGKQFAEQIRKQIDPHALVYVFGSVVKGTANIDSDIDIAVVSKIYDGDIIREGAKLSSLAQQISWDIEVHDVPLSDWYKGSPHVFEIQRWGIPV